MQVLYEDRGMTISWTIERVLESIWKGFAAGKAYRNPLERPRESTRSKRVSKILSDMRNLGAVAQGDHKWTEPYFAPKMSGAGVKHWALVLPAGPVGQLAQRNMQETVDEKLEPPHEQFDTDSIKKGKRRFR